MTTLLRGTAFITGAASGIGLYTARSFAKYGIERLALADLSTSTLEKAIAPLREQYPQVEVLPLEMNVRSSDAVRDGIAATVRKFGRLDIAVNNAGIGGSGNPTHMVPEDEWARVLDVDLNGVWRCQKAELEVMLAQEDLGRRQGGRGVIVNTASMYGLTAPNPSMHHTAYAAAKHGVMGLTKGDGNSYGPKGIRINAICPGYVATPLLATALESPTQNGLKSDVERSPLQRMADMEEIGDAITFLASPLASFMQSAGLVVDGGFTQQ